MPISKASGQAVAVAAKGDLVVGSATNDAAVLSVGSANQVLTVDSSTTTGLKWAAASAGANFTLLNTGGTSLTAATTITVSGISGANKILVVVIDASAGSSDFARVRFNTDSGTNYGYAGIQMIAGSTYAASDALGVFGGLTYQHITLGRMAANGASVVSGYVLLDGCNSSGVKVFTASGSGDAATSNTQRAGVVGGLYNSSSTISSVSIISSGSNFDGGTVYVYTSA